MSKAVARLAVAALLASATLVALAPPADAATTRVLSITAAHAGAAAWKGFDGNPPKTFDIDGDGDQEILAQNDNHNLYVFDSGTGKLLATLKSTYPAGWGARTFNGPEAYRENGVTRVVQVNSAAFVTVWRYDPAASTATSFAFVKEWERRMSDCFAGPGSDSKPVLADLDRDGRLDILMSTEESGIYALKSNGQLYWKKCIGGGNGEPRPVDLNGDGWLDVVFASDGGVVTAMQGRPSPNCTPAPCPATIWAFSILSRYKLGSASVPVGAGIGQLDGVGGPDIVVGARDSHDPENWENDHALLLALSSSGQVLWAKQDLVDGNPLTYTHPIVADADRDGRNEVYWADWNTIGHKPPWNASEAWRTTGPANFYRYDHQGNLVWKQTLATFWNNKDLALADVDGDGQQEILATGPNGGHEGIWYLNSATGAKEAFVDAYPWMVSRGPVLADLRGTGTMQFVLEVGPHATSEGAAVHVYDTGVPYSALWPHVPGAPGVDPVTSSSSGPDPTTSSGPFDATFRGVRGNEWWVQAEVSSNGPTISQVDARVDGGSWRALTKQSWNPNAWAASFQVRDGSVVQLRATTSAGQVDTSACHQWIPPSGADASVVACPGGPTSSSSSSSSPPTTSSGPFDATFRGVRGNEWWVQADVSSNGPTISQVDARVDGGSWRALTKQSWSPTAWAASFQVKQGSVVQLRAIGTDGQVDTSACHQWIPPSGADASVVACPGGPTSSSSSSSSGSPPPGEFTASFAPRAVGNDWWVEVGVTANRPVAKVEAQRDGGAWVTLDPTDWGTYAKSVHTPNGTQVVFRATDALGATATSGPVTWT